MSDISPKEYQQAEAMAWTELFTQPEAFKAAMEDFEDTVGHRDWRLGNPSSGLARKIAAAKVLMNAVQRAMELAHYGKAITPIERALAEVGFATAAYWVENRAEQIIASDDAWRQDQREGV